MNQSMKIQLKGKFQTMLSLPFLGAVLAMLVTSCGTETGNPVIKRPTTPRLIAQDTTEAELLELAETISETGVDSSNLTTPSVLAFAESSYLAQKQSSALKDSTQCSSTETRLEASVERKSEKAKEFKKALASVKISSEIKQSVVWDSPLGGLSCSDDKGIQKKVRFIQGATEIRKGSVKRTLIRTGNSEKRGYKNAEFASSGERTTKFELVVIDADKIRVEKSIFWDLKKTSRISTEEGESADESTTVALAENPIKIVTEKNRDPLSSVRSRIVKSGTTITTRGDGSKVEINFENMTFTSGDDCYPVSGKLRGKITPMPSSGENPESFEIDFSSRATEIPELVFTDGEKVLLSGTCFE